MKYALHRRENPTRGRLGMKGVVADSQPIKEYNETVNKAKALINALEK